MKLPTKYDIAKEKIELQFEEMMEKIQVIQQKMITLQDELDKGFMYPAQIKISDEGIKNV